MRLPFFYGWLIVVVTFVTMAIGVNARTAFSLFFPPIIGEFGWDRGLTAGAFSFGFVVSAAVSPLIGRMMDRFGPRGVMELGVALMGGGLLLAPLTTQPWHLYLTIGVLVGAGSVCLGYSGQSLFLPNWFIRRRGLAMGLAFAGVGIGSVTLLPWVQHMIEQTGWRTACTAMGILVLVVLAPINLLLRKRPEDIGLLPDGDAAPTATSAAARLQRRRSGLGRQPTGRCAARCVPRVSGGSRSAISPASTSGTRCRCTRPNSCSTSVSAPNVAVWALGVVSLLGIPGQIWLGHLSDRIGREWIWAISCAGFAICFAALIGLKFAPVLPLVYLMIFAQGALGYGLTSIMGAVVLEIFQGKQYGSIFGTIMLAALAGGAAGPWATGLLYDLSGSYTLAFAIGIAVSILSAIAIWQASPGKVRAVAGKMRKLQRLHAQLGSPGQVDEIPIAFCRSLIARRKLSAGVVSGSIRRCRRKPSSSASRIAPVHVGFRDCVLAAVLRRGLDDVGDQFSPRAQALGEFGPAFFGARHEQDHLHVQEGGAAERILPAAVHGLQRVDEIRGFLCFARSSMHAPNRLLDVIFEHGDDQLVLALEIRIERAAREAGGGRDDFDAGAADSLFLEHARRRFEQFLAGVVPCGSGSDS